MFIQGAINPGLGYKVTFHDTVGVVRVNGNAETSITAEK